MLKRLLPALFAIPLFLGGADAQSGKVAMLLPGSINDQSWNAAGYAGLVKLKEQGMDIAYSENVQAADHIEAMKDYARKGYSPVIGHSGRFLSPPSASAPSSRRPCSSSAPARAARART
jgi:basic membrane lipoprotein Med (substrate-binding protein (PBP1-ABC) superfamily)